MAQQNRTSQTIMSFDNYIEKSGNTANDNAPVADYLPAHPNGPQNDSSVFKKPSSQYTGLSKRVFGRKDNKFGHIKDDNALHYTSENFDPELYQNNSPILDLDESVTQRTSVKSEKRDEGMGLAVLIWLGSIAALAWTFFYDIAGNQQLLASVALIWTGLWVGYLGQDRQKSHLGDFGTFTSILGFISALMAASMKMNIPLSLADCISVLTIVCLICSLLAGSRIALIMSACSALLGVFLHFQGQVSPYAMIAFPAIWSMQLYQASKLRSFLAALGVILVGYYWIFGFTYEFLQNGSLSTKYATTLIFLFGAFQYRAGKAAADEHAPYAMIHMLLGWCIACIGAMATQATWIYPDLEIWTQFSAPQSLPLLSSGFSAWTALGVILIISIFFANLVRWKNNRLALSGVIAITLLCAMFAFTTVFETEVRGEILKLSAFLGDHHIGFAMGAGVIASAVAMAVNGARWQKTSMMCTAAIIFGAQIILLINPEFVTVNDASVFGFLLLVALCVTTALSGRSIGKRVDHEIREDRLNA